MNVHDPWPVEMLFNKRPVIHYSPLHSNSTSLSRKKTDDTAFPCVDLNVLLLYLIPSGQFTFESASISPFSSIPLSSFLP